MKAIAIKTNVIKGFKIELFVEIFLTNKMMLKGRAAIIKAVEKILKARDDLSLIIKPNKNEMIKQTALMMVKTRPTEAKTDF